MILAGSLSWGGIKAAHLSFPNYNSLRFQPYRQNRAFYAIKWHYFITNAKSIMDYLKINRITELDFDAIIESAGGEKIRPEGPNAKGFIADYVLNEAIIELKFIREEGLVKKARRKKIAELMRKTQPDKPVVVLDSKLLSPGDQRLYFNLLGKPIQTAIKKAAKQLSDTKLKNGEDKTCVLIILNDGYTALNMDEFGELVSKKVRNDTTKIDYVIAGGIYYYSDGFDMMFFPRFDLITMNVKKLFPSFDTLFNSWMEWVNEYMTATVVEKEHLCDDRLPVIDLNFNIDGIEFVKPAPPMGMSTFWQGKRPRTSTTKGNEIKPVATVYPKLSKENWAKLKKLMPYEWRLRSDYPSWTKHLQKLEKTEGTELRLFVPVEVHYDEVIAWHKGPPEILTFDSISNYATEVFNEKILSTINTAIDKTSFSIIVPSYIFLRTEEIGDDKSFDISSIYYVNEIPGFMREVTIVENKRLSWNYALALASAYAIQAGLETVVYEIDKRYSSNYVPPSQ